MGEGSLCAVVVTKLEFLEHPQQNFSLNIMNISNVDSRFFIFLFYYARWQ